MKLTDHFDLDELTASQTADRLGLDNTPTPEVIANLTALCVHVLEPLREALGQVLISSGYRSPAVNAAIGSGPTSQHVEGRAADLSVKGRSLDEVFNWLLAHEPVDQVIREFPPGGWVHVSHDPARHRRQGLMAIKVDGKVVYRAQGPLA